MGKMAHASRLLLGTIFVLAGVNGLWFVAGWELLFQVRVDPIIYGMLNTGFMLTLEKVTELACGILLLANRYVPLVLVVLAPIVVNIVGLHLFRDPAGLPQALLVLVLQLYLVRVHWQSYRPLLRARPTPTDVFPEATDSQFPGEGR